MNKDCQIIVLNPGSTSTKAALYNGEAEIFTVNIPHPADELAAFPEIVDQLEYRRTTILDILKEKEVDLHKTDAFSAICTGLLPMPGGVYEVNELMYEHGKIGPGSRHPGNLGPLLAKDFAEMFDARAFVVNPSSVDEFCTEARVTGLKEILRTSRGHPLNQKEVSMRFAKDKGLEYKDINLIVAHMGGGISITAHRKGQMIDTVDSTRGEGRMAPTRTGALPVASVIELCFSGKYTEKEFLKKVMKSGGWVDHLGTSDALEVEKRIGEGDKYAEIIYNATAYQIAKDIGACAAVLKGDVDGIIFTGGLAHSKKLTGMIKESVEFIAPVYIYAGEFEMEGLARGALRVLRGDEEPLSYTGKPVFKGFTGS